MAIDLGFVHDYEVELIEDGAASGATAATTTTRKIRIPDAGEDVDAVTVCVTPRGAAPWVGSFARGFASDDLVSGIYAWPDAASLCVVSAGYGYVVKAADPKNWVRLQPMPITDVRLFAEHKLIVFTDFTHMFAYNAEKNLWKSDRLSWDGITVSQVATNHIFGLAWDATLDKEVEFAIDVRNGQHTGGAQPWSRR